MRPRARLRTVVFGCLGAGAALASARTPRASTGAPIEGSADPRVD